MDKEKITNYYFENEAKKLHNMCDYLLRNFNIPNHEVDDFYDIAHETFISALNSFDDTKSKFSTHLQNCLNKKFITEMRDRQTDKRFANHYGTRKRGSEDNTYYEINELLSFDMPIGDEDDRTFADTYSLGNTVEDEVINSVELDSMSTKTLLFIEKLSQIQKQIAMLLADGKDTEEICEILQLEQKQYDRHMKDMRSYEKVQYLF